MLNLAFRKERIVSSGLLRVNEAEYSFSQGCGALGCKQACHATDAMPH